MKARTEKETIKGVDPAMIHKLRECKDIIKDWEDWSPQGFRCWQKAFDVLGPPYEFPAADGAPGNMSRAVETSD
jgi:hypothetical protein